MCIAIPMRIVDVLSDTRAVATRPGRTEEVDTSFAESAVELDDLVLVFKGSVLRRVSVEEGMRVEEALTCVEEAMRTDSADGVETAFADILANTGKLPAHLQALVGKAPKSA